MERKLVANRWQTPDGTILWSRFGHDCVFYDDMNGEKYMVDGGNEYERHSVNENAPMKSLCVYDDSPWATQRQYILRGTFNESGHRIWVPMDKLSNKHLENIIKDDVEYYDRTDTVWTREMEYRKEHNIFVAEHSYENEYVNNIIKKTSMNTNMNNESNKKQIIEDLYKSGKITFEQAMVLASSENTDFSPEASGLVVPPQEKKEVDKKEKFINDLINDIAELNEDEDGTILSFDYQKIIKFMNDNNWTWGGKAVDKEIFKDHLKGYIRDVVTLTVKDVSSGTWKEDYDFDSDQWPCLHSTACGGIEVESWYNYDDETVEVEVKFVSENCYSSRSIEELK